MSGISDGLIALIAIFLLEFLCFGSIIGKIGFYMDDWSMYAGLHFGPNNWLDLTTACLKDPKVIIRPLEAPYFALLFKCFGNKPLGHHLVNAICEAFGAWFLYLGLARVCQNRAFAFISSAIFLLYPNHDATHYWLTASSATVSLSLYTLSFWQAVKGFQDNRFGLVLLSAFTFLLSVFNYESFMPLFPFTLLCCLFLALEGQQNKKQAITKTILYFSPYLAITVVTWWYRRVYLPRVLPDSWTPATGFDLGHIITVYREGFNGNIFPPAFAFFGQQVTRFLSTGIDQSESILFVAVIATSAITAFWLAKSDSQIKPSMLAKLSIAGFATILSSYSIYALALTYVPGLDTIINRINAGASVGTALIIASLIFFISSTIKSVNARSIVAATLSTMLLGFFVLSNWGLSKPWIASWGVQKHIRTIIENKHSMFKTGDSIILANAPRYVMWAPLFDGVWDFQNMVRWSLNNKEINAGVVSERIVLTRNDASDISHNYRCGTYSFKSMHLLTPAPETWYRVPSAERFIEIVENHGMAFGLDKTMPSKWRTQLQNN